MRKLIEYILLFLFKLVLSVRYRVTVKGLEKLDQKTLHKPGGVLFIPNHAAIFVDPTLVALAIWKQYPIRPMIVEYMYYTPIVYRLMKFLNALPVPDFDTSSNTLKRKRSEKVMQTVIHSLAAGENFLIYPAGRLKSSSLEVIGGSSGVHQIVQAVPEANVVLVRIKGLWGSSFSRALLGKTPPMMSTIWNGVKIALKNFIFFTPKREVIIEFEPVPKDFPRELPRLEFNHWLERWYNTPDGLTKQEGELPGDSLVLVSYSMWREEYPEVYRPPEAKPEDMEEVKVSEDVEKRILDKLAELTEHNSEDIKPEMNLSTDMGLDSLDIAEISAFLQDQFDVESVPVNEIDTVNKLYGLASKQIIVQRVVEEEEHNMIEWRKEIERFRAQVAHGDTMPEVFLHNCERMENKVACADQRSGVMTYSQMKLRAILLAEYIRHLPGEYIGIMLPASSAAYLTILATQLAGKIPMMVNWTVGSRHLNSVKEVSKAEVILSSWAFVDRLKNVSLEGIEDNLVMLEDVRRELSIFAKIRAYVRSKYSTRSLLKLFHIDQLEKESPAVLLFTSGTESMPKGVPLSHHNILSNQRSCFESIDLYSDDVVYGILPPFHSFGFTISGLMGLLAGVRVAYFPDPTDGKGMVKGFAKWGATVMCGAPTFIKGLLKAAKPEQLKTMRLCVTGAEKAPPELFQSMGKIGKEQCLIEGYGITETSPVLTVNRTGKPRKGVGEPIPGVELHVVDPDSHESVPIGSRGLILARGPNVFSGYLNPGLTSPFVEVNGVRWYNTGDLGYLDEEGRLTISGRLKRFLKIGPEMVSLPAIEDALLHAATNKGWPVAENGPALAICGKEVTGVKPKIMMFSVFDVNLDEINSTLKEAGFSNLVKVSDVVRLEEIPVMGTGKVNYRQLEDIHLK